MNEQEQPKRGRPPKLRANCPTCGQETMADKLPNTREVATEWVEHTQATLNELRDLIRWLAPRIERRNGNGQVSDKMCILCVLGQPQYKREPCRHGQIWEIGRGV